MITGPFCRRATKFLDEICLLTRFVLHDHLLTLRPGDGLRPQREPFSLQVRHRMPVPADRAGPGHVACPRSPAVVGPESELVEGRDEDPLFIGVPVVVPSLDAVEMVEDGRQGVVGALVESPLPEQGVLDLGNCEANLEGGGESHLHLDLPQPVMGPEFACPPLNCVLALLELLAYRPPALAIRPLTYIPLLDQRSAIDNDGHGRSHFPSLSALARCSTFRKAALGTSGRRNFIAKRLCSGVVRRR